MKTKTTATSYPSKEDAPDLLLTTSQLAHRWQCAPGHLANQRSAGTGPSFIKLGSRVLYPLSVIQEYESARLVTTTAGTA